MIPKEIRDRLLAELEKFGNIYVSCAKVGTNRMTYRRWCKRDPDFRRRAEQAITSGRLNIGDAAEYGLLTKIKQLDLGAIKFGLTHNHPRYKPQIHEARVIIDHHSAGKRPPVGKPYDATQFVREAQAAIDASEQRWSEEILVPVPTARAMAMRAHEIIARTAAEEAAATTRDPLTTAAPDQPLPSSTETEKTNDRQTDPEDAKLITSG